MRDQLPALRSRPAPTGSRFIGLPAHGARRDRRAICRALGVGACYTSPYFTAEPGSTHGYDVCNHNEINPELGGAEAHAAFIDAARRAGTAATSWTSSRTTWGSAPAPTRGGATCWRTARARRPRGSSTSTGRRSRRSCTRKLLLPILGDQYGKVLERGELQLAFRDGALVLHYFEHELPINPRAGAARVSSRPSSR